MTITCPQCRTKFLLDEERIPAGGGKARCSRCRTVFEIPRHPASDAPAETDLREGAPPAEPSDPTPRPEKRRAALTWIWGLLVLSLLAVGTWALWEKAPYLRRAEAFIAALRESLGLSDSSPASIGLENLRGYYIENIHTKWIFVVEGQAVNHWNETRSFLKVRGTLLDAKGRKVEEKAAFCGNILGEKDLREMTRESIQKSLSSQFGVSFSNVNVPPRKSVPFMVVFTDFSQNEPGKNSGTSPSLSDFSVEVVSSKKGSK
jgi:predicted Zn finger-like uncharacterized protein